MITYSENAIALDTAEDAVIDTRVIDVDLGTAGDSEVAEKAEKRNLQTSVDSAPAEVIKKKPLYYRFIKRTFDVVFSLVVILITFIPMLILSLFVAIDTKAFPIYSQVRVGQRGEFRFYKMRTMVKDSDDLEKYFTPAQLDLWSKEHKVPDDPRIDSRIIETNAKRPLSALAFASAFPPKMTVVSTVFPQVNACLLYTSEAETV